MRRLAATIITATLAAASVVPVGAQEDGAERILFIGNSYTSWGTADVADSLAGLVGADSRGSATVVDDSIIFGVTLAQHLPSAPELIRDGGYSVVVLQGDLPLNEGSVEPFFDAARSLDAVIGESGGRTVFYMTWTSPSDAWLGHDGIVEAHRLIGDELDAPVAPVAVAMMDALDERPDLALTDPSDDFERHQTDLGAYLAAATIYATVYDRTPEGLAYVPPGVTENEAAFLQRVAWEAVQGWQQAGGA